MTKPSMEIIPFIIHEKQKKKKIENSYEYIEDVLYEEEKIEEPPREEEVEQVRGIVVIEL